VPRRPHTRLSTPTAFFTDDELATALALALILHPARERERPREDLGELRPANNLADDVTDDAPEHRAQAP
jgi:hypothetical protein